MTTLPLIIQDWLSDDQDLNHFRLIRYSFLWIMCPCMIKNGHECFYRVRRDCIEVYGEKGVDIILLAADPQFFDKLRQYLSNRCTRKHEVYSNH